MEELKTNLHIHTTYSDGSKTHKEIIHEAARAGIDALIFTDHNIFVDGIEGYYQFGGKKILVIMGEEIHDPNARPQKNHLLALGIKSNLCDFAENRNTLIKIIHDQDGAAFLAHPYDPALPNFNEPDISWEDWTVKRFDGIELWNGFSELKVRSKSKIAPYFYAFFPGFLPFSPPEKTIRIWDGLHASGKKAAAIAGSDAHAITFTAGFLKRVIFPYRYHFKTINNHILIEDDLKYDFLMDKKKVISALRNGNNFIANDLISDAAGFRFQIKNRKDQFFNMGDTFKFSDGLSALIHLPHKAEMRLIKDGECIHEKSRINDVNFPIHSPGVYRVEIYRRFKGRNRAWIFSNPIYIS